MPGKDPTITRALGLLAGDLWKALTGRRPAFTQKRTIRRETQEHTLPTADGTVTLRRTTTDEVELRRDGRA